ncbi:zinc finger protein 480-like [Actinia tenebrosa]|uniref:Zinc finger protein 480-like n=1 Tax=Actinia tenebrosa TaxID=6105 RepID=A0A6P8I8J8_ACTTE|nr:zinc finger protein 480-like [Actinia tenebrosa]
MNVDKIPSTSNSLNPKHEQKKIQEKAKRELDAIIQSWKDNSEGIVHVVSGTEKGDQPLQDLHASYPSGREEIEGSNCSSLQLYLYENEATPLNGGQSVPQFSMASKFEVQSNDELQVATGLCHQAGDVVNSAENYSSMCLEDDRNLAVKTKLKNFKFKDISVSTVVAGAVCSSVEKSVSTVNRSDGTVGLSVGNDTTDSPYNNNQKKNFCNSCRKYYKHASHLSRHIKAAHENQKPHLCNICNATFTRSESLIGHLRKHEQRDKAEMSKHGPYKCPKCHKSYQQAYNVTRHLLSHNGVKPFKCTECNKSFTQYTGLSRHLVLHKGSRDFECKKCGKSFARLFVLNRHMLTHTDDKPYKCFVCSKSFIRASQLSIHMNSHQKKGSNSSVG